MRAAEIRTPGEPPVVAERDAPVPGDGELLVEVVAAPITPLGWTMFVELPVNEAYASLYQSFQRLAIVLLGFAAAHWRGTKGAYPLQTEIAVRN
jgi:hypothetical protein